MSFILEVSVVLQFKLQSRKLAFCHQVWVSAWHGINNEHLQDLSDSTCVAPYGETLRENSTDECDSDECSCDSSTQSPLSDTWPTSVLPGCSKGKEHAQQWIMTTSMMQAYLAMKGRGTDGTDPLLRLIAKQDKDGAAFRCLKGQATTSSDSLLRLITEQDKDGEKEGRPMGYIRSLDELQQGNIH